VGSLDDDGVRSSFSNHGPWVACCTRGESVVSTFVTAQNALPEEATGTSRIDFDGWASWSGTSFAAPKVAGALACIVASDHVNALNAWQQLIDSKSSPTPLEMGVALPDLAP